MPSSHEQARAEEDQKSREQAEDHRGNRERVALPARGEEAPAKSGSQEQENNDAQREQKIRIHELHCIEPGGGYSSAETPGRLAVSAGWQSRLAQALVQPRSLCQEGRERGRPVLVVAGDRGLSHQATIGRHLSGGLFARPLSASMAASTACADTLAGAASAATT